MSESQNFMALHPKVVELFSLNFGVRPEACPLAVLKTNINVAVTYETKSCSPSEQYKRILLDFKIKEKEVVE